MLQKVRKPLISRVHNIDSRNLAGNPTGLPTAQEAGSNVQNIEGKERGGRRGRKRRKEGWL